MNFLEQIETERIWKNKDKLKNRTRETDEFGTSTYCLHDFFKLYWTRYFVDHC